MAESTAALVVHDEPRGALQLAFEPRDFPELIGMCRVLFASGLLPKAIQKLEAAVYIAIRGRELGLSIGQSFASIFIIDGKTVLSGDLIAARVRRSKLCASWRILILTNEECTIETLRVGDATPTKLSWHLKDAERAGLLGKDNWRKFPRAMLRARCSAELARAVYPEEALGMYDHDEVDTAPAAYMARDPANDTRVEASVAAETALPAAPAAPQRKIAEVAREFAEAMRRAESLEALSRVWEEASKSHWAPNVYARLETVMTECAKALNETQPAPLDEGA